MTIPISVELDIPHFKESHWLYITLGMNGSEIHEASKIKGNHVINIEHFPLLPNSRNTLTINVSGFQKDWNEDPFDKVFCRIKNIEFDEIPLNRLVGSHGKFRPRNSNEITALPDQTIRDNGCWSLEFDDPFYYWMFEQT